MEREIMQGIKAVKRREREKFFFFKQKTAYEILTCDWSSDVCSSDLQLLTIILIRHLMSIIRTENMQAIRRGGALMTV